MHVYYNVGNALYTVLSQRLKMLVRETRELEQGIMKNEKQLEVLRQRAAMEKLKLEMEKKAISMKKAELMAHAKDEPMRKLDKKVVKWFHSQYTAIGEFTSSQTSDSNSKDDNQQ